MTNYTFIPLAILILILLFIVDSALTSIFSLFDVFSCTILFLVILAQSRSKMLNVALFFVFGLLIDWYYKKYLGLTTILSLIVYSVGDLLFVSFAQNKVMRIFNSFFISYVLAILLEGYTNILSVKALIISIINCILLAFVYLLKER